MNPVSVVIPFYNDDKNYKEFFERNYDVIKNQNNNNEIIAVDDTGNTALVEGLKNYNDVILIRHSTNKGFSISVNDGVDKASNEIVFLLNSDILLTKDALISTIPHFINESLFAVTLKSQYPNGKIREGAKSLIWKGGMPKLRHAERHFPKPDKNTGLIPSIYAVGGHCAVRKSMYQKLNGMDHDTFHPFYWEDTDLGYRAIKNGWKIIYEPKAEVIHPPENSSIKSNFQMEYINKIKFRNRTYFALKNFNSPIRKIQIRFYLTVNFLQKFLKYRNASEAYEQSLGLIKKYRKLKSEI